MKYISIVYTYIYIYIHTYIFIYTHIYMYIYKIFSLSKIFETSIITFLISLYLFYQNFINYFIKNIFFYVLIIFIICEFFVHF